MTGTLILLTVLGVVTVFWEPLTALALGAPAGESMAETRAPAGDGGAAATPSTKTSNTANPVAPGASPALDASGSS